MPSAAVVIGALRLNMGTCIYIFAAIVGILLTHDK